MNNIVVEVVPMFFEIQGKVMMEYGYAPDDEGFGAFGESLKTNEGSDEEYDKLAVRPTTVVSNFFSSRGFESFPVNNSNREQ